MKDIDMAIDALEDAANTIVCCCAVQAERPKTDSVRMVLVVKCLRYMVVPV